jgi:hypothetical protein
MSITIALFTACSAPKPTQAPSWYTSKPKDFQYFYAVGSGKNITSAKNKAILNLRQELIKDLNSNFENKSSKIKASDEDLILKIKQENEKLINTMSIAQIKVEKTASFNNEQLILLKLSRKSVFEKFDILSSNRFKESRELYAKIKQDDQLIKKYSILNKAMQNFPKLASITQAKENTLSTNTIDDVNHLNTLLEEYQAIKNKLSIYVLPDVNSRIYIKSLKEALANTGLELSSEPKSDESLRLIVTSQTQNNEEYGFNVSKTLVKYTTYDKDKNVVAFRQHTFSAKSRKNYNDAKIQTAMHQKSMIKKLGVFEFIGVK